MARILLVDDSPTERMLIGKWVRELGHDLIEAHDAEEGLVMAREHTPDAVLMDVILPGKNGFEATRLLRKDPGTQSIPVIIISTKGQPTDVAWGKRQGAVAYLPKPFASNDLAKALVAAGIGC